MTSKIKQISVIIPAKNEAENIQKLIRCLGRSAVTNCVKEIIIVVNCSEDATEKLALAAGARIVRSVNQRAAAMNSGAKVATGNVLYFLHADSCPPKGFDRLILQKVIAGTLSGCFRFRFNDKSKFLSAFAWFSRLPWYWVHFGDQSLFVEAKIFKRIRGFNSKLSIMEDSEIVGRLKKTSKFGVIADYVTTSTRKYQEYGYFRVQLYFILIVICYHWEYHKVSY